MRIFKTLKVGGRGQGGQHLGERAEGSWRIDTGTGIMFRQNRL
jgi:hypothetical protein